MIWGGVSSPETLILKARLVELAQQYKTLKLQKFVAATAEKAMRDFNVGLNLVKPFFDKLTAAAKGQAADFTAEEVSIAKPVIAMAAPFLTAMANFVLTDSQKVLADKLVATAKGLQRAAENMGAMDSASQADGEDIDLGTTCDAAQEYIGKYGLAEVFYGLLYNFCTYSNNLYSYYSTDRYKSHHDSFSQLTPEHLANIYIHVDKIIGDCNQTLTYFKDNRLHVERKYNLLQFLIDREDDVINFENRAKNDIELDSQLETAKNNRKAAETLLNTNKALNAINSRKDNLKVMLELLATFPNELRNGLSMLPSDIRTALDNMTKYSSALNKELEVFNAALKVQNEKNPTYWLDATAEGEPSIADGYKLVSFSKPRLAYEPDIFLKKMFSKDIDAVDANDINQGKLGDCYLLAPLAAIANTSPSKIKEMIKFLREGVYSVRLYLPTETGELKEKWITVTTKFPLSEEGKGEFWGANMGDGELWVMLIEKAYAKAMGGYQNIDKTASSNIAYQMLTGQATKTIAVRELLIEDYLTYFKKSSITNTLTKPTLRINEHRILESRTGEPICVSVLDANKNLAVIYLSHIYYFEAHDEKIISLKNPQGKDHLLLNFEDYLHYFNSITMLIGK